MRSADELRCPSCGRHYPADARFCDDCRMPLVAAGRREEDPSDEAHERARKIDPRLARGRLIQVGVGRNQAEAELIQGMLLEQGVPSMLRRTRGFDVPDFLAAGPRDVLVPESGAETARGLLAEADVAVSAESAGSGRGFGFRLAAGMLVVLLLFVALAALLWVLTG